MRLFQNSSVYDGYLPRLRGLSPARASHAQQISAFLDDCYAASHFLKPVVDRDKDAFLTNGNDERLQRTWAAEHGMPKTASLGDILLAQIEEHRADVFYNLDPIRFGDDFVRRLPSTVKRRITWRAAPSPHETFGAYDLVVCNFPGILERYAARGMRTAYFFPAHDEAMDAYAANVDRPVDVLFVGGYSRHHRRRAGILEAVAELAGRWKIHFHLDRSRLTRLAESPLGIVPPLRQHRRPAVLRRVASPGVFGRDLYKALSSAKIVLNAAVDMAGEERGNMRCFEAIGCGALLLSDEGRYPSGMRPQETLVTYRDADDAVRTIERLLAGSADEMRRISHQGNAMIRADYSRERQWEAFQKLCA